MSRPAEKIALLEASLEKKENDIKVCPHAADTDLFLNVGFKVASRICTGSYLAHVSFASQVRKPLAIL